MIKILLINLDSIECAGYSALVASSLVNLNKDTQITLVCVEGAEIYESIGIFENIYQIEREDIFGASSLNQIREKKPQLFSQEWDYVINNSRDTDSAGLAASISAKEKVGPVRDSTKEMGISHNSFFSFLLSQNKSSNLPFHIGQIYYEIVNYHNENNSVPTKWGVAQLNEIKNKFKKVQEKKNKKYTVLVDAELGRINSVSNINFFLNFVKQLDESKDIAPILLTRNIDNESYIIDKLRSLLGNEIHVAAVEDKGLLGLLSSVDLVVTDNVTIKTFSDIVHIPSLFINSDNEIPLSNYSINPSSLLINSVLKDNKFVNECVVSGRLILSSNQEGILETPVNVFKTLVSGNRTIICPLGNLNSVFEGSYYSWLLSLKYLSFLEKMEMPELKIDSKKYTEFLKHERTSIKEVFNLLLDKVKDKESYDSLDPFLKGKLEKSSDVLLLALSYSQYNNNSSPHSLKKFLTDAKPVIKDLMVFLANEETVYQNFNE